MVSQERAAPLRWAGVDTVAGRMRVHGLTLAGGRGCVCRAGRGSAWQSHCEETSRVDLVGVLGAACGRALSRDTGSF